MGRCSRAAKANATNLQTSRFPKSEDRRGRSLVPQQRALDSHFGVSLTARRSLNTHTHTHLFSSLASKHICIHPYVNICAYIHTQTPTRMHTYRHTCTHAHIHTPTFTLRSDAVSHNFARGRHFLCERQDHPKPKHDFAAREGVPVRQMQASRL